MRGWGGGEPQTWGEVPPVPLRTAQSRPGGTQGGGGRWGGVSSSPGRVAPCTYLGVACPPHRCCLHSTPPHVLSHACVAPRPTWTLYSPPHTTPCMHPSPCRSYRVHTFHTSDILPSSLLLCIMNVALSHIMCTPHLQCGHVHTYPHICIYMSTPFTLVIHSTPYPFLSPSGPHRFDQKRRLQPRRAAAGHGQC